MRTPLKILLAVAALALAGSAAFAFAGRATNGPISCGGDHGGIGCALDGDKDALPSKQGPAPDFTLPTLAGQEITLSYVLAQKPVILDFWASWCPHCQRNMPKLDALYRTYQDRVEVLGIDMREKPEAIRRFVVTKGISYPVLLDAGNVAASYGVRYTNTHVLISKDGTIRKVLAGDIREQDIQELLSAP